MHWLLWVSVVCMFLAKWRTGLWAGIVLQSLYLGMRGLALGRLPLLGPHDTMLLLSLSLAVVALTLSFAVKLKSDVWLRFLLGAGSGAVTLLALLFRPMNMPLPQILDTPWFELHVVLAFLAYALFAAGSGLCVAFLLRGGREYLEIYYKSALVGWAFFSASMIAGGIWGYYAWGTYWLWTAKELWTSILWLYYAMALHLRLKGAGGDRLSAWLGVAGGVVMLFTYLGVSLLMKSSHSF